MAPDKLGFDTTRIEEAPDGDGIELQISDEIAEILNLEPGDPVDVTVTANRDGTLTLTGDLLEVNEITDEQRAALQDALDTPEE